MLFVGMLATTALFGLSGSFHCAVMCGPLAGLACRSRTSSARYFISRLFAYLFLGFISGFVTSWLVRERLERASQHLAIAFGVVMGAGALVQLFRVVRGQRALPSGAGAKRFSRLRTLLLRYSPFSDAVTLGLLTALLPCGFLYMALLQAALFADPILSAVAMGVFAISTSPALWAGTRLIGFLSAKGKRSSRFVFPVLALIAACLVIWRGAHSSDAEPLPCHVFLPLQP